MRYPPPQLFLLLLLLCFLLSAFCFLFVDASALFQIIHDEFESHLQANADSLSPTLKVSQKSLKTIQKNLVEIPVGTRVDVKLAGMPLGDVGVAVLVKSLAESKNVRSLSLVKCGVDGESISTFAKLVHSMPYLEEVNFSGNTLSNVGANILLSSLNPVTPIPCIILEGIGISDDGVTAVLNVMATARTSFSVDLSKNTFSPTVIDRIIAGARKNTFVVGAALEGTGMTEAQGRQLYEVLARNQVVTATIDSLLNGACRRNFKSKLVNFRESVQQNKGPAAEGVERAIAELPGVAVPVYKVCLHFPTPRSRSQLPHDLFPLLSPPDLQLIQKTRSMNVIDVPSQRFQLGTCLDIGRRNEMQDVLSIKGMFRGDKNQDFFGLFDGHGGRDAASHCAERLPLLTAEFLNKSSEDPAAALKEAFARCQKEMAPWSTMVWTCPMFSPYLSNLILDLSALIIRWERQL